MPSPVRLVVFDLDGTLIDSSADLAAAVNALVAELGGETLDRSTVVEMVGEGAAVLVRRALTAAGLDPAHPGALARFLEHYDSCLLDRTHPYDGMIEVLETLRGHASLAVLTNKPSHATERILEGLGLRHYFGVVVGGDTALGRKPDPAGLASIISRSSVAPADTTLVGDSPIDLETARRAGTRICLARYGFGYRFTEAPFRGDEWFIDSPRDLVGVMRGGV